MTSDTLAFFTPGPLELIVVLMVALVFLAIPVVLIVLAVIYVSRSNKERQKLRLKVEKLTDELEQVRKQVKGGEEKGSSSKSE